MSTLNDRNAYTVTMSFWVECCETQRMLISPEQRIFFVQPPIWTKDDEIALEMHLDHLAKIQYLVELRKNLPNAGILAERGRKFQIRALMHQWMAPWLCDQGAHDRKVVTYPPDRLRAA